MEALFFCEHNAGLSRQRVFIVNTNVHQSGRDPDHTRSTRDVDTITNPGKLVGSTSRVCCDAV